MSTSKTKTAKSVYAKLLAIQSEIKIPKSLYSEYGGYNYRSAELILDAVKPVCAKHGCIVTLSDSVVFIGDRYYIQATATLVDVDTEASVPSTALAREAEHKTKMDDAQVTGSSSSYARKVALQGLFALDDGRDADSEAGKVKPSAPEKKPTEKKPEPKKEKPKPAPKQDKKPVVTPKNPRIASDGTWIAVKEELPYIPQFDGAQDLTELAQLWQNLPSSVKTIMAGYKDFRKEQINNGDANVQKLKEVLG